MLKRVLQFGLIAIAVSGLLMWNAVDDGVADSSELDLSLAHKDLQERIKKYAPVQITYDESVLSDPEKRALAKLVQAAAIMDEIFLNQVWSGNEALREHLAMLTEQGNSDKSSWAAENQQLIEDVDHFFRINFGPWDRLDDDHPFIGSDPKPATANYYPEDITKEQFDEWVKAHPNDEDAFRGFFTRIKRSDYGLVAVPYSTVYKQWLERAGRLLHESAELLDQSQGEGNYSTLTTFLRSRADAFMSNDYQQSDMDWMDVENNIIDVTIGPYEVYEDGLFGYKAAFEAFIAIRHPEDSKKLAVLKNYLQELENSLPIPDEHKNPNRGSESPIAVVDLVYSGGDTKAGVQTLAYNLPNDETVRELKGSKKVMLKNISHAKFDKILLPIAKEVLDPKQLEYVQFDAYFNNVLMHEMAHGLGPGKIVVGGTETTVGRELQELYPPIEEAKADITGLYCRGVLVKEGFYTKDNVTNGYVSFLPGFFRAIRFGVHEAHGKANLMEFNYMREKGGFSYDEKSGRFHVNLDKMPAAVEALTHELLMIEANGSYEAAQAFIDKYGKVSPDLEKVLKRLESIPVDIEPLYTAEKYLKGV